MLSLRDLTRALKRRLRLVLKKARYRLIGRPERGVLSVVIPMYNVEAYIEQCIMSVLRQEYGRLQVVVVDDGSPDRSIDVARRVARNDVRVEIVRQKNGGLSAARNAGAKHARGEFITFLDSDDFVEPNGYRVAVDSLQSSGSDFAVMSYRRELDGKFLPVGEHIAEAHRRELIGTSLASSPGIMVNAIATSKVFRRSFWDQQRMTFAEGFQYEDQFFSMQAYTAARSIDFLQVIGLNWRIRTDGTSITQNAVSTRNLADLRYVLGQALELLESKGSREIAEQRAWQLLAFTFVDYLPAIPKFDDAGWEHFVDIARRVSALLTAPSWQTIQVRRKILILLSAAGHRDLAIRFLEEGGWNLDRFMGRLSGASIVAELPLDEDLRAVLPAWAFEYSETETRVRAAFRGIDFSGERPRIRFMAHINHVRLSESHSLGAALVNESDGTRIVLNPARERNVAGISGFAREEEDMSEAGVVVDLPDAAFEAEATYSIEVTLWASDMRRTGSVLIDAATVLRPAVLHSQSGLAISAEGQTSRPMVLAIYRPEVLVESIALHETELMMSGRTDEVIESVALVRPDGSIGAVGAPEHADGKRWTVRVPQPTNEPESSTRYRLCVLGEDGAVLRSLFAQPGAHRIGDRWEVATPLHRRGEHGGGVQLRDTSRVVVVTDVVLEHDAVVFSVLPSRTASRVNSVRADNQERAEFNQQAEVLDAAGRIQIRVPLQHDPWGYGNVVIPPGIYALSAQDADGCDMEFRLSYSVISRFPVVTYNQRVRLIVVRGTDDEVKFTIRPPREPELWADLGRRRLQAWSRSLRPDPENRFVLFRNHHGSHANDSALAVYDELRRRDSRLGLVWAVKDYSMWVPQGARVVLEDSVEFYEAFGTATYLMLNILQPTWHKKPEGQIVVQTHHGYPFKIAGAPWWRKLGFSAQRIEKFWQRSDDEDYLVSPSKYATPHLGEFYRDPREISPEVLEIGYPRNDVLVNSRSLEIREEARRRLGIPSGKRVVLYAPTFRDYLSDDQVTAEMVDHLDPEKLARELGGDYVVLLRGHLFNTGATKGSDHLIDVTEYPDINHLILASDMAVLDYSSLRFDYALTKKPAFFFVPDRDAYFEARGELMPYAETVYGPLITTYAELVECLLNVDSFRETYSTAREAFVARYMELEDGRATARLVDRVFAPRGDA